MNANKLSPEQVVEVLRTFAFEGCQSLFWREDDGVLTISVDVSDVFAWGCADTEEVTPQNLPALLQAYQDAQTASGEPGFAVSDHGILFAARNRGLRPQGAMYSYLDSRLWPLFDAAGPRREVGLGNPRPHPSEKTES